LAVIATFALVAVAAAQSAYVNFEGKQTRPICLSPDGTRLFAVNTPDARLSVFDVTHPLNPFLIAEIPVGLEPVSVNARDSDEVWVVNEVSDSVSVVSLSRQMVTDTLQVKDEPADVVFASGKAFVTAARNNRIAVFDAASRALLTNLVLFGENPRSLAVNSNGTTVFAAFALSGNHTTLVPQSHAPPQITNGTPPMLQTLPPPPQVSLIVDATNPAFYPSVIKQTMPDHDVVEIDVATLTLGRYFPRVGTVNFAIAVQPGSGDLFVANTEARNLTHFEPALRGFFVTNRIARINVTSGSVTNFDLNRDYHPTNFTLLDRTNALAQPAAMAFGPSGANFYLAAFGSDRIARVASNSGNVISRIELSPTATGSGADPRAMRGPRGLALLPGAALYSLNRISGTISVINPKTDAVVREIPIGSHDPTPPVIRQGRGFLYDAKLSGNGTVSCASCHIDAEMDLLAWDLGDPTGQMETNQTVFQLSPGGVPAFQTNVGAVHPMKGPMTTQTLRGLKGMDPLHWRGDRTNFTHFKGAFASLLGGATLSASDMNTYRDFINTIVFQPNPNQNLDRTMPASFAGGDPVAGRNTFLNELYQPTLGLSCNTCHRLPTGSDRLIDPDAVLPGSQDFKVPHLRNLYQKTGLNRTKGSPATGTNSLGGFGFTHDGEFQDLFTFLSLSVFGNFQNDTLRKTNLQAFLLCFDTGTAPAVGQARTLTAANVNSTQISNVWSVLEAQAAALTNIDLIVKGTLDSLRHGLLYQPAANNYQPDTTNAAALTRAQLVAKVQAGDTLTLMGVPPGTGHRLALDRDGDGVLDADGPLPRLQITRAGDNAVITWPFSAVGFRLESSTSLATNSWSGVNRPVGTSDGQNVVTNPASAGTTYFRLRQP
jgi:YVTN family beta-propeller protein